MQTELNKINRVHSEEVVAVSREEETFEVNENNKEADESYKEVAPKDVKWNNQNITLMRDYDT